MLGYPVAVGAARNPIIMPWATCWLLLLSTSISLIALFVVPAVIPTLAFMPLAPLRYYGVPLLTSVFLHRTFFQLICNMYLLWVFGKSLERYLGSRLFVALLIVGSAAGHFGQLLLNRHTHLPCVGVDGVLAAIMVCHACLFPRSSFALYLVAVPDMLRRRVDTPLFRWVRLPVFGMFILWLLFQLLLQFIQHAEHLDNAIFSYLGGAASGIGCWWVLQVKMAERAAQESLGSANRVVTVSPHNNQPPRSGRFPSAR